MNRRDVLKQLAKLATQQYQLIDKLAQMQTSTQPSMIHEQHGQEAAHILAALPPAIKATVERLEVPAGSSEVKVRFVPGKGTQSAYDAIMHTVSALQKQNTLPGNQYKVTVA